MIDELRLLNILESIAASLQDIAAHTRGQLTMDLSQPQEPVPRVDLGAVLPGFADMQDDLPESPPEPPATRDQVIAALNRVAKTHGTEVGKRILSSQFGVSKLADLPEEKYGQVVKACGVFK